MTRCKMVLLGKAVLAMVSSAYAQELDVIAKQACASIEESGARHQCVQDVTAVVIRAQAESERMKQARIDLEIACIMRLGKIEATPTPFEERLKPRFKDEFCRLKVATDSLLSWAERAEAEHRANACAGYRLKSPPWAGKPFRLAKLYCQLEAMSVMVKSLQKRQTSSFAGGDTGM